MTDSTLTRHELGHLGYTAIAKLIREDIKAAKKAGKLPKALKVSVRTSKYAGGGSINLSITGAPFRCLNAANIAFVKENPNDWCRPEQHWNLPERLTDECQAAIKLLKSFHAKYNWDNSDIMTDYFDVNYYGSVEVDWKLEKAEREAIEAELAEPDAPDPRVTALLNSLPPVAKRLVREEGDLDAVLAIQNICCEDHIRVAAEAALLAQS